MDLLALADFTLVARYGGFGRASRAAHRPKATLSRRVAGLEASLNLRLFERGTRDLKLTEEGRALYERAGQLLTELEETAAAIASGGTQVRGRMRISVPLLFSQIAMGRLAAEFARRHPDVRLEVTTEDRAVDMIEEEFDLAIRVNPDPNETLVGRPFLRDRLVVVASPDLPCVDGAPVPAVVRHVAKDERWSVTDVRGEASMDIAPVLCLSSMIMIRDAVRAGAGAAQLPISLVAQDIAQGRLSHWADVPRSDIVLWALYPTRRLLSARVSAFRDFLKDVFPTGTPDELGAFLAA
ncbi:LysR family transcriptional regulator [Salinicola sp. CPA57]|uniref:LysR family transcriptional regulator n=1 Tax=Salinicola sp. CPA57 TaxID=1949080 RepID=UPI000DA187E6|nr:LysR family transcriptional regulator [Salinicola sp. CPA57]